MMKTTVKIKTQKQATMGRIVSIDKKSNLFVSDMFAARLVLLD